MELPAIGGSADLTLYRDVPTAGDVGSIGTVLTDGVGDLGRRVDGAGELDRIEAVSRLEGTKVLFCCGAGDMSEASDVDRASVKPSYMDN